MAGQGNHPFNSVFLGRGRGRRRGRGLQLRAAPHQDSVVKAVWTDWFFEAAAPPGTTGQVKVWLGSWVAKPIKVWLGGSWQLKPLKRWSGSAWVTTPY